MSRRAPLIAGIVGVAVLALVVLFVVSPKGETADQESPLLGKLAPQLVGTTMAGESFDLDAFKGDWVLVNFFATWCPPCVVEHPELIELSEQQPQGLEIVSVAFGDTATNVEEFFAEHGGSWPVLASDTGAIGIEYGVKKLPESFLVAPDGSVVAKFNGGITAADLTEYLARSTTGAGS